MLLGCWVVAVGPCCLPVGAGFCMSCYSPSCKRKQAGYEFIIFIFTVCVLEHSSEENTLTMLTEVRRRLRFKESLILHNIHY